MAIHSEGAYASVESSDKKSSTPVHSEAYQNTTGVMEITNGAPVTNELSIEDAIEILGMGTFQRRILWVVLEQDWQFYRDENVDN
mmetsp:Transcript_12250/g.22247  ORF Transcript_12250/g.22247 Transcript_12250/m.22247 type:complete len:85 (-) Transcript_12250:629-883(-)